MTDHQQDAGPVDVPAQEASTADRLRAALIEPTEDAPQEAAPEEQEITEEVAEGQELEAADFEDEGETDVEGESPIDAPVSLNAKEKEAFAQLPKEAQDFVSALEARRNADVTKVTTKAADAQRVAEQQAAQAAIQAKQVYAAQLKAVADNFAPQMPDPSLAQTNPAEYIALKAQYDAVAAQHDQFLQQITAIGQEAEAEDQAAFIEARDKALMQIPEIANPETRQDYLDRVFDPKLAERLGYDRAELAKIADAEDVKRLATIATAFEKADKYDQAMSNKMKRVRQGKARNTKPTPAQQNSSTGAAYQQAIQRQKATGGKEGTREALRAALLG